MEKLFDTSGLIHDKAIKSLIKPLKNEKLARNGHLYCKRGR